jgi:hypothetical protein
MAWPDRLTRYREIWVCDTEYITWRKPKVRPKRKAVSSDPDVCFADRGAKVIPICWVGTELRSGVTVRRGWSELEQGPPHSRGSDVLVVAYMAMAEWSFYLAAGWPLPERAIDLYPEYKVATNGVGALYPDLLSAAASHGIKTITKDQKDANRDLVRGGGFLLGERERILDYCEGDVATTAALFRAMLPVILSRPFGWEHALLRGAYTLSLAKVEWRGVPVDLPMWERLQRELPRIKPRLIEAVDRQYGVYRDGSFNHRRFEAYLAGQGFLDDWERTPEGRLRLERDYLKDMARRIRSCSPCESSGTRSTT